MASHPKPPSAGPALPPKTAPKSRATVATQAVPKTPARSASRPAAKPLPAAAPGTPARADAAKKKSRPKLVRDGFTMPESDFALIAQLKAKALGARREAKKSELLRAGLHALAALDAKALVARLDELEPLKVGRPRKGH